MAGTVPSIEDGMPGGNTDTLDTLQGTAQFFDD
jgi:hypothetical protein